MKGTGVGKVMRKMHSFSRVSGFLPAVSLLCFLLTASCTKTSQFNIGEDFVDSQTKLTIIDTFKVNMSTILVDSMVSASTKTALVGACNDPLFGKISSESYFDLTYETFSKPADNAIFDSAAITLSYSKYYYGDTTSRMTISIHQLTEQITPFTNGSLYNNSSFPYSPEALGTLQFYPQPASGDTLLRVHVDPFGEELFNLIRSNDQNVSSSTWFNDYIKGFVIVPDSVTDKAVIGFSADNNHLFLKIYYHIDTGEPEKKEISIEMGPVGHQFNHIRTNFAGTPLAEIKSSSNILSSDKTGNMAFMQGYVGLLPKIQFPTLQNLFMDAKWKILKAELVIEPEKGTYDIFKLPKVMDIYDTDRSNRILNVLADRDNNPLTAVFNNDDLYNENTNYTYNITGFINNELSDMYFDYQHGLLIGLEQNKLRSTLDRLVVECRKPPVKLRIYYLSY